MAKLIGVLGFAGSGKDTFADYLIQNYGYKKVSFANALKDVVSSIFLWDRDLLEGSTTESRKWREQPDTWWEKNLDWDNHPLKSSFPRFTPRAAMQMIGTDIFVNKFFDSVWVLRLKKEMENLCKDQNIIITDCRQQSEYNMIKELNGITVRITKDNPSWVSIAKDTLDNNSPTREQSLNHMYKLGIHRSEWDLLDKEPDFEILNDSTKEDFYSKIDKIL